MIIYDSFQNWTYFYTNKQTTFPVKSESFAFFTLRNKNLKTLQNDLFKGEDQDGMKIDFGSNQPLEEGYI